MLPQDLRQTIRAFSARSAKACGFFDRGNVSTTQSSPNKIIQLVNYYYYYYYYYVDLPDALDVSCIVQE